MKSRALAIPALAGILASTFLAAEAAAQECVPKCRAGFECVNGLCARACNPACAPNEVCTPDARCVSACNPPCAANEACTPDARCVSACNPACAANEVCTPDAQCVSAAPAPAPPTPAPAPAPAPAAAPATAPAPAAGPSTQTGEPAPGSGAYVHDGFYFNIGLGLGSLSGTAEPSEGVLADSEISASGLAILTQLAIGTTVAPGLVIGGGIYGATVPSPTLVADFPDGTTIDDETESSSVSQIGPFVAYYFSAESGAHFFGAPALSIVSGGKAETYPDEVPETSGTGFGLVIGGGYEFWVAEQWSIGVIGRFQYVSATLEDDDGSETDFSGMIFGVLAGATLH